VNWRVVIRPNAEADLNDAQLWYETRRSGLGDQLLDEVAYAVKQLTPNGTIVDNYELSYVTPRLLPCPIQD